MLIAVHFIDQFGNGRTPFGVCVMLVDTLLVGLLDGDHRIPGQVLEFRQDFLCHLPYAVLNKPGIFMRGENHRTFVPPLQELINSAAHRFLEDGDDLFQVHMLVIIGLDTEETLPSLVMGGHGHSGKEFIDLIPADVQVFEHTHRALFHDILGAGTGRHSGHFGPDAFPDDGRTESASCYRAGMDFDDLMAGGMAYRGLAFYHELTSHEHFRPICIFMTIEQFPGNDAAEFLDLVDFAIDRLLEHFVNHFEVAREVRALQAAGQVDIDIEVRDEDDGPFLPAMYFNEFLYVFYSDAGKVDPDIRGSCLYVGKFPGE